MRRIVPFLLGWAAGLATPLVVYLAHEAASKFAERRSQPYCAKCLTLLRLEEGKWVADEDEVILACEHHVDHYVSEDEL